MSRAGFALPLLLWLIAGMSLLATAVIQFAHDEIRMSDQRAKEARVNALARGLALLAEEDSRLASSQDGATLTQHDNLQTFAEGWWAEVSDDRIFTRRYEVGGHVSDVVLAPGNAYVSLNDASGSELEILLREVGIMTKESAKVLAETLLITGLDSLATNLLTQIEVLVLFTWRNFSQCQDEASYLRSFKIFCSSIRYRAVGPRYCSGATQTRFLFRHREC